MKGNLVGLVNPYIAIMKRNFVCILYTEKCIFIHSSCYWSLTNWLSPSTRPPSVKYVHAKYIIIYIIGKRSEPSSRTNAAIFLCTYIFIYLYISNWRCCTYRNVLCEFQFCETSIFRAHHARAASLAKNALHLLVMYMCMSVYRMGVHVIVTITHL